MKNQLIFSERLDGIFYKNGFSLNPPTLGKGYTFDLPLGEKYERRIRCYYDGQQGYMHYQSLSIITIFCMDRRVQKTYEKESDITEDQIQAFITLCK